MQKYEDISKIFKEIESQLMTLYNQLLELDAKIMEEVMRVYKEVVGKFTKMYKETLTDYEALAAAVEVKVAQLRNYTFDRYNELKPKVIAFYKKYDSLVRKEIDNLIAQGKKIEMRINEIYDDIKDIPVKELVEEFIPKMKAEMESILNQTL